MLRKLDEKTKKKIIFFSISISISLWLFWGIPLPTKLSSDSIPVSTKLFDRNGKLIYEIYTQQRRSPINLKDLPQYVVDATISIEDKEFYKHSGFSPTGILRSVFNIVFKRKLQGGSTITQQLVKNTLLKRASETAKLDKEILTDEILSGQTALVISEGDPISFIQVIGKFTKEFSVPQMKVGIIDGLFQNSLFLSQISILPSKDILLSQLLGVLSGNLQKLVYVLSQKAG